MPTSAQSGSRAGSGLQTSALITQAVGSVLPYPYNYGAKVLTDAVQIAACQRTRRERLQALAGGMVIAMAIILGLRR